MSEERKWPGWQEVVTMTARFGNYQPARLWRVKLTPAEWRRYFWQPTAQRLLGIEDKEDTHVGH
jgi:hypothetical protein